MPHGWAIAEVWLLLRDCLLFEDAGRLVLLAGVPPEWFRDERGMSVNRLATEFGLCSFRYAPRREGGGELILSGEAQPPLGFVLRHPNGDVAAPASAKRIGVPM